MEDQHPSANTSCPADERRRIRTAPFWLPLGLLFGVSVWFRFSRLDENLASLFWDKARWPWAEFSFVRFLYDYGTYPALGGCAVGLLLWIAWLLGWQPRERGLLGAFLVALMLLGPGLLVNTIFKDHFGRPRPRETSSFNGAETFRVLGDPVFGGRGKSFPSGHASMGFYWLGLFVFYFGRKPGLAFLFGGIGIGYGGVMGVVRMAQGGHWASDVLWSCGFVYFTAWGLRWFMFDSRGQWREAPGACVNTEKCIPSERHGS